MKPKTYEEHQALCERMGNMHLNRFQRAKLSMAEALKVAKEVYPDSNILDGHARELHNAGKSAEAQGYVLPWMYMVGTFFYLSQENGRAVYLPWCYWGDDVTKLGADFSRVVQEAIAHANQAHVHAQLQEIIHEGV